MSAPESLDTSVLNPLRNERAALADTAGWRLLYPFASREFSIDGHRYHYVDEGQGPPLLMVHGNPTWSFYWHALIAHFRSTHRVVAVDHMGCGLSDKPRNYDYRLATHISNLSALVEALDLREATLVAHDWGGPIGIGAALQSPQRFTQFVMFNTGAFRMSHMPWRLRLARAPLVGPLAVRGLNAFARAAIRMATARGRRMPEAVRAGLLAPYGTWHDRQAILRFVEDIPLSPRHPSYGTLLDIERGLTTLADRRWLFIWGMQDWCFDSRFLGRFVEFFSNAEVHRLQSAAHYVVLDAADEIVPILFNFLARTPRADDISAE